MKHIRKPVSDGRFTTGMRVQLSEYGRETEYIGHPVTGTVKGFSRDGTCIIVLPDRRTCATAYHKSYWEPLDPKSG